MSDTALMQLLAHGNDAAPTLLVLDENATVLPHTQLRNAEILTNRYDIHESALGHQLRSRFNDFAFDTETYRDIRRVCYRISKEKRVVEHVLQSAWKLLPVGGELVIAGYKNEGIKTFAKRISDAFGCAGELRRGESQLHLYRFAKTTEIFTPLCGDDYHALHEIGTWNGCRIHSKPGVFAWDRFDAGSQMLLTYLPEFLAPVDIGKQSALDLGCGNGLLAIALLQAGCGDVTATDNNAAAIRACEFNLQQNGFEDRARAIAGNCGNTLQQAFDLVVCNPPFHQGFDVEQDLTTRFLQTTRRLLKPEGRALFVVNAFIPLERKAHPLFSDIDTVADNRQFKLVALRP